MAVKKTGPQATNASARAPKEPRTASTRVARGTTTARARAGNTDSGIPEAVPPTAGSEATTSAEDRPGPVPLTGDVTSRTGGRRPSTSRRTGPDDSGYQRGGCEVWPD